MQPERCPACGEPSLAFWRTATPPDPELRAAEYRLLRCLTCGSAVTVGAPAPAKTAALYERQGRPRRWLGPLVGGVRRLISWDRGRTFRGLAPGSRVFEVGAGRGHLLQELRAGGHTVAGIEPSRPYWEEARSRGIDVENRPLEDATVSAQGWDVVVLWHVLEHLEDPAGALSEARTWLRAQGRLVVSVPALDSWQARIGGDRWHHQDVPRHRTHFTVEGLRRLFDRTGFRVTRIRAPLVEHSTVGMWLTLLNRLTVARNAPLSFLKRRLDYERTGDAVRDGLVVIVLGPPLLLLSALIELVAGRLGRGGAVTVEGAVAPIPPGPDRSLSRSSASASGGDR